MGALLFLDKAAFPVLANSRFLQPIRGRFRVRCLSFTGWNSPALQSEDRARVFSQDLEFHWTLDRAPACSPDWFPAPRTTRNQGSISNRARLSFQSPSQW